MKTPEDLPATRAAAPAALSATGRIIPIDALRGFDMLWIIGAREIVWAIESMKRSDVTAFLGTQLQHAQWEGFHFC